MNTKVLTTDGTLKRTKFKVKPVGKFFLHHKSQLNDPTLQPRKLDASENIFDIIMPWLPEQKEEDEKKNKELHKLGRINSQELKSRIRGKQVKAGEHVKNTFQQKTIGFDGKIGQNVKKEIGVSDNESQNDFLDEDKITDEKQKTTAEIYSKHMKVAKVEEWDWSYEETVIEANGKKKFVR